jgi:TonB family protein
MAELNNDIEKYLRRELPSAERHALEQKALRDPFLAEALEGAEHAGAENFSMDIAVLQQSIHEKSKRRRPRILTMHGWGMYAGIAAGLSLLAISSYVIFLSIEQEHKELAYAEDAMSSNSQMAPLQEPMSTDTLVISVPQTSTPSQLKQYRAKRTPRGERDETLNMATQPANDLGPIAETPLETVSGEGFRKRENEREVVAELSEPPVIGAEADLADDSPPISKPEESKSKLSLTTSELGSVSKTKIVRGKVIAAEDETELPGVNVLIKGTSDGTVTDAYGNYELVLSQPDATLVFSFIGYTPAEVRTAGKTELNVKMGADVTALSELVVTGYSTGSGSPEPSVFKMAEPEGGRKAFKKYLEQNMQYPKEALQNKIEGKVTVQFTIEPTGQLGDFTILKGLGHGCDDEVIRLIKEGPAWSPSLKNNQPVKENVKVRLKFEHPDK